MRRLVAVALVAFIALGVPPADAQSSGGGDQGSSTLDPWSLQGHLLVNQSQTQAESKQIYDCAGVHFYIGLYNDQFLLGGGTPPPGWPNYISIYSMSLDDYNVLVEHFTVPFVGSLFDYPFYEAEFCTTIHEDGWLAATSDQLEPTNPFIHITIEGNWACSAGQLLMIQSTYWFSNGSWSSGYGTDWQEVSGGIVPGASGTYNFDCMDIVPGSPGGFAQAADEVPSAQDNVNPTVTGATGLDTWLWYDFTDPGSHTITAQVTVPARGTTWTLDMTAWVDEVHWDVNCEIDCDFRGMLSGFNQSGIDYSLDLPDTRLSPAPTYDGGAAEEGLAAATHVYRTKGDYVVSTATVWRGTYVFGGITYTYDPVVVSTSRPYEVIEIRSIVGEP